MRHDVKGTRRIFKQPPAHRFHHLLLFLEPHFLPFDSGRDDRREGFFVFTDRLEAFAVFFEEGQIVAVHKEATRFAVKDKAFQIGISVEGLAEGGLPFVTVAVSTESVLGQRFISDLSCIGIEGTLAVGIKLVT